MSDAFKRPSLREAARRGAEANRRGRQEGAAPQPTTQEQTQPPAKGKPPVARVEQVAAKCGHPVPFDVYPDGKDKFREQRRQHVAGRDCPECRQQAHEARTVAEQAAARERRAGRAKQEAQVKDRLPHGARFDVIYDAQAERWTGTLTVPTAGAEPAVFTASAGGVFRLLRELDRVFRGGAAEAEPPHSPPGPLGAA